MQTYNNSDSATSYDDRKRHQSQAAIVEEQLRTQGYNDVLIRSVQQRDRDSLQLRIWVVVDNNSYSIKYQDGQAITIPSDPWLDRDFAFATKSNSRISSRTPTRTDPFVDGDSGEENDNEKGAITGSVHPKSKHIERSHAAPCDDSKKLCFSTVTIREHPIVLGDNVTIRGPPISLSWDHQDEKVYGLEDYEQTIRERRRSYSQLKMPSMHRDKLLKESGYSRRDIQEATKLSTIARNQRKRTIDTLHLQPLQEAFEKIVRIGKNTIKNKPVKMIN